MSIEANYYLPQMLLLKQFRVSKASSKDPEDIKKEMHANLYPNIIDKKDPKLIYDTLKEQVFK